MARPPRSRDVVQEPRNLFRVFVYNVVGIDLLNAMIAGAATAFFPVMVVSNVLPLRRWRPVAGRRG
ncbi:MAG: hypothetical protein M0Z28_23360 [Rhodospirillales bacterium]|nr:hypothetical protein [Rhodospirillales bacterium]